MYKLLRSLGLDTLNQIFISLSWLLGIHVSLDLIDYNFDVPHNIHEIAKLFGPNVYSVQIYV